MIVFFVVFFDVGVDELFCVDEIVIIGSVINFIGVGIIYSWIGIGFIVFLSIILFNFIFNVVLVGVGEYLLIFFKEEGVCISMDEIIVIVLELVILVLFFEIVC